jgi:hypothetical protein
MQELRKLSRQISDLEASLAANRGMLDSRLYYRHEDGVAVAELARNTGITQDTTYEAIDRYRASLTR